MTIATENQGFDSELYLKEQTSAILERMNQVKNKLYLEFGGKLLFDYHAARVLPGYDYNIKMRLLQGLKDQAEILLCIYAGDIERKKIRADFGIAYDADALKLMDDLKDRGLNVSGVVITRFEEQPSAIMFKNKLEHRGVKVYIHRYTKGYPTNIDLIVSELGYGVNDYVPTSKPLVVITGPGPGSGKLATCLSQMYHDHKRGVHSGYAKFETFPIWDLPLKHPVNIAYEAATADIGDFNLIDPFHLEAYGKPSINYNRDVEAFPLLMRILRKLTGENPIYASPTDMGVNRAREGIVDDDIVQKAARQEIIRRYFRYSCEYIMGFVDLKTVQKAELLMEELQLRTEDRLVVEPARLAAEEAELKSKGHKGIFCGAALQLHDGSIITGSNSALLHAGSSLILNAAKHLAGIPREIPLLPNGILESIGTLKDKILRAKNISLNVEETLIALSISAASNPAADAAVKKLQELRDCDAHMTHLPSPGDEAGLKKLGVHLTSEPQFASSQLFTL